MLPTLLRTLAAAASALLPALVAAAGSVTYFHNDLAGSPVAATDASGQVLWRESWRPYGERLVNAPAASANTVWFTSRRQDPETGLVYMGARFYDPLAGRFVSPDPVGFDEANLHSFNRYAYANNNPYKYVDPDGASPVLLLRLFGGGAIGGVVGAAADAASQYAAFGSVDWGMAARSTAAQEGAAAGALSFLPAGTPAGLGIKPVASGVTNEAGVVANGIRGRASEARVLQDLGLTKNTASVSTMTGRSIPDALTSALSVEVKDTASVSLTRQLQIQTGSAKAFGRESVLITGKRTCVSGPCARAFDQIIRRPDLGPK
jgi:RHS repeat-associated protein